MGCIAEGTEGVKTVIISHGHMDHIGSLHKFLSYRQMRELSKPYCISPFKILYSAMSALDRGSADTIIFDTLTKY